MLDRCSVAWRQMLAMVLWLATAAHAPFCYAEEATVDVQAAQAGGYQYSDDWNIVSAPPPPGPYETVNVDPRVPGQDVARPVPKDLVVTQPAAGHVPADPAQMPPPGAGRPAVSVAPPATRSRQGYTLPPPAGAYSRQGYGRPPASGYSPPGGYPGRQTYPGYGQAYRQDYGQGYRQGYKQGQGYNRGYGYTYPGQYAPSRQQDIPPPPYAHMPGR